MILGIITWSGYTYFTLRQTVQQEHAYNAILDSANDHWIGQINAGYDKAYLYINDEVSGPILCSRWLEKWRKKN